MAEDRGNAVSAAEMDLHTATQQHKSEYSLHSMQKMMDAKVALDRAKEAAGLKQTPFSRAPAGPAQATNHANAPGAVRGTEMPTTGPRGGVYHVSRSGEKVYEKK